MTPKKKTLKDRVIEHKKYRIKKTTRDVNAPLGVDYTPEVFVKETDRWLELSPVCYKEEDAVLVLQQQKSQDNVKIEYIYPRL
jgi:hypothetical protein